VDLGRGFGLAPQERKPALKILAAFLIAITLLAAPASAQKVTLVDPVSGSAYRAGVPDTPWQYAGATGGITNTSDVAVAAAAGANVRNYLCGLQIKNTSAVASEIVAKDGSTIIWRGHVGASMTFMETITFPVCLKGSANTALNIALITTSTATVVSAQGYTAR
jgi:hypothetical protein